MWLDPGDRDYYIEPLIPVWDAVQASKNVQGGMIWAWVDDVFLVPGRDSEYGRGSIGQPEHALDRIYHIPGRGIVGDAPWGIVDGWRRKKPEFWHVKMLMSPVHLQQRDLPAWKAGEPATFTVDNRYEFTNLSELALEWSVGSQHGTIHPDVAPRTSGRYLYSGRRHRPSRAISCRFVFWIGKGRLVIPASHAVGSCCGGECANLRVRPAALRYLHEAFWLGGPMERVYWRQLRDCLRWREWPHSAGADQSPLRVVWNAQTSRLADRIHA